MGFITIKRALLRLVRIVCCCVTFSSLCVAGDKSDMDVPLRVTTNGFYSQAPSLLGQKISVAGYLVIDNGFHLYPSLSAVDYIDTEKRVEILGKETNGLVSPKLSGCFVTITGVVKAHRYKKSHYILGDITAVIRSGFFYFMAKDKLREKGVGTEPKCEVDALVNAMTSS